MNGERSKDTSWKEIFRKYGIDSHDFDQEPYKIAAKQIKSACQHFTQTGQKEVRILCKQDSRESRPLVFKDSGLFLLPVKNGEYKIIKGEGYVDIPPITSAPLVYKEKLDFDLETVRIGDSEMQHLDYAYAVSIIRSFLSDDSLVLTIRGRKYTPPFDFYVGDHFITTRSVQTEVDSGYEGRDKVVIIEAKNSETSNTIIRQLYYPYRQWQSHTKKRIYVIFFEKKKTKKGNEYHLWQFQFDKVDDYNSISLVKKQRYLIA